MTSLCSLSLISSYSGPGPRQAAIGPGPRPALLYSFTIGALPSPDGGRFRAPRNLDDNAESLRLSDGLTSSQAKSVRDWARSQLRPSKHYRYAMQKVYL